MIKKKRFGISDGATTPRLAAPPPAAASGASSGAASGRRFQSSGAKSRTLTLGDVVAKAVAKEQADNNIPRRRYRTYAGYR